MAKRTKRAPTAHQGVKDEENIKKDHSCEEKECSKKRRERPLRNTLHSWCSVVVVTGATERFWEDRLRRTGFNKLK
jgi:hypothetical protein